MLFNSIGFLIFFAIVGIAYYALPHRFRWMLLLAASCYFYMAFIPAYILILFYLIIIDFGMGLLIEKAEGRKRKVFLVISILANVGTLFFFKYFNFFNANVAAIANLLHWSYPLWTLQIALPLGLSFHTFQSLAYVIEVYKKRFPAEHHLGIYALYVMFFPQLVAGPIERPQQLLPQLHEQHPFNENAVTSGLGIMCWGFFKKVVIADTVGVIVDTIWGNLHASTGPMLAVGAIAFAIQLYADFSGYSDIARGAAKTLGIALTNNFRTPYFSRSVTEFWRRWHISLSSWFRDYCFQPLALSLARISRAGIPVALFLTFLIIGLWHGAGWTYIVFGGLFGAYLVVGMLTKKIRERIARLIGLTKFPTLYAGLQMLVTFLLVCIGFVFFRTPSLTDAVYVIVHLALGWTAVLHNAFWSSLVLDSLVSVGLAKWRVLVIALSTLAMFIGEYVQTEHGAFAWFATQPRLLRWSAYYLIIFWILVFGYYQPRTFIYFQF